MQIFTDEWSLAYRDAINASEDYRQAAANWQLGALALVARAESEDQQDSALSLALERGQCLSARALTPEQAAEECAIVLEASNTNWELLLSGSLSPTMAIMAGKLKVTKGSVSALIPYIKASEYLIQAAPSL